MNAPRIRFHSTIVAVCRENEYRIDDEQLSKLLTTKSASDSVAETLGDDYFRVLLRRSQMDWAESSDPSNENAVVRTNKAMTKVVNAVLWTDDIKANPSDPEGVKAEKTKARQSATGFARSAACVLRAYTKAGGKLRDLDPMVDGKNAVEKKTKVLKGHFAKAGFSGKVLVIDGEHVDAGFKKAAGTLPGINVMPAMGANVYDILNHDTLVLTKAAVEKLEARFNG